MFCYKNGLTFNPFQPDLLKGTFQNHHEATNCTEVAKSTNSFQGHQAHSHLYFFFFSGSKNLLILSVHNGLQEVSYLYLNAALSNPWPDVNGGTSCCLSLALSFLPYVSIDLSLSGQPLGQCPQGRGSESSSVSSIHK